MTARRGKTIKSLLKGMSSSDIAANGGILVTLLEKGISIRLGPDVAEWFTGEHYEVPIQLDPANMVFALTCDKMSCELLVAEALRAIRADPADPVDQTITTEVNQERDKFAWFTIADKNGDKHNMFADIVYNDYFAKMILTVCLESNR